MTRIKRDYPEFRDRLDTIAERDLTQTKAVEMVGHQDFQSCCVGSNYPDLMLLKDIGSKFDVNLNTFRSFRQQPPQRLRLPRPRVLDWAKVEEGAEYPNKLNRWRFLNLCLRGTETCTV